MYRKSLVTTAALMLFALTASWAADGRSRSLQEEVRRMSWGDG
jgi:hypothetical protein